MKTFLTEDVNQELIEQELQAQGVNVIKVVTPYTRNHPDDPSAFSLPPEQVQGFIEVESETDNQKAAQVLAAHDPLLPAKQFKEAEANRLKELLSAKIAEVVEEQFKIEKK